VEGPAVSPSGTAKLCLSESPRVPFLHQRKPQVPPLRSASVGMTELRVALDLDMGELERQRQRAPAPRPTRDPLIISLRNAPNLADVCNQPVESGNERAHVRFLRFKAGAVFPSSAPGKNGPRYRSLTRYWSKRDAPAWTAWNGCRHQLSQQGTEGPGSRR
jgi:hypothetical protein